MGGRVGLECGKAIIAAVPVGHGFDPGCRHSLGQCATDALRQLQSKLAAEDFFAASAVGEFRFERAVLHLSNHRSHQSHADGFAPSTFEFIDACRRCG